MNAQPNQKVTAENAPILLAWIKEGYTVKEVAEAAGVSETTVRRWTKDKAQN